MGLLKKINPEWNPKEAPDLKVGDTLEITDYKHLVRSGAAILVDDKGEEIALPGQVFACPICYKGTNTLAEFVAHVDEHKKIAQADNQLKASLEALPPVEEDVEAEETVPVTKEEDYPLYVSKKEALKIKA